ncbi:MAG: hypothetical protein JW854_15285 [Actinobacteria bacterium]|nr:hypothetical protein [Actinomycetota bacterium]
MRIYITHCSAKKDESLRKSGKKVTPDKLYTATPLIGFINQCELMNAKWAIFSDQYGVLFSKDQVSWYEKNPDRVTREEFESLHRNFDERLQPFDEIWFYHNPGRFHGLYRELINSSDLKTRIRLFSHKSEIMREK